MCEMCLDGCEGLLNLPAGNQQEQIIEIEIIDGPAVSHISETLDRWNFRITFTAQNISNRALEATVTLRTRDIDGVSLGTQNPSFSFEAGGIWDYSGNWNSPKSWGSGRAHSIEVVSITIA